jgi:hypothetical protein
MSAYEELVERCVRATWDAKDARPARFSAAARRHDTRVILAEVLRTLETVTPEMWDALPPRALDFDEAYLAMLRASPITPPK